MATEEQILDRLSELRDSRTIILTIGHVLRGDDAVGPLLCEQLKGRINAEIIDAGTVPENYIQTIIKKAPENLLIIDAIDFAAPAGTIEIFNTNHLNSIVISTHCLSPRVFVDMIAKEIDVQVQFLGIQPCQTQIGAPLSDEVDKAVQQLISILTKIFGLP